MWESKNCTPKLFIMINGLMIIIHNSQKGKYCIY